MEKLNSDSFNRLRDKLKKEYKNEIRVGMSTCGIAAGADEVYKILLEEVKKLNIDVNVKICGCLGACYAEPIVEVISEDMPKILYGHVDKETAYKIIEKHILGKMLINDHIFDINI